MTPSAPLANATAARSLTQLAHDGWDFWIDACQRSVLLLDVLRQRSERYREHAAKPAPHVLKFGCELVMDGRKLSATGKLCAGAHHSTRRRRARCTQAPVRDRRSARRPRARHRRLQGAKRGRRCPQCRASLLLHRLSPRSHARTDDRGCRPCGGGVPRARDRAASASRGQAGRGRQLPGRLGDHAAGGHAARAFRPDHRRRLTALLLGRRARRKSHALHRRPARRQLAGGADRRPRQRQVRRRLAGPQLREPQPSNTLWTKHYNLYSKVDTEAPRYLEFEEWWGGHVLLNAEEMQFIVDELFVGNKLAAGEVVSRDGSRIDLRNIRSPIVVFCSKADNITPPPQALDWILDLYESVDDIRAHGQTIVYAIHESIGHLGIFVSGSVAKKEHDEFASNIDLIDVLPPGLYEAVMEAKAGRRSLGRPHRRQLSRTLRDENARRYPRAGRQRRGG